MFNFRRNISAGELRELYLNQGLTMTEIAERYQVAETTIRRRLSEIGVI
jgi:DNA-binding transcriptional regulator LsrR (DeoR family)